MLVLYASHLELPHDVITDFMVLRVCDWWCTWTHNFIKKHTPVSYDVTKKTSSTGQIKTKLKTIVANQTTLSRLLIQVLMH